MDRLDQLTVSLTNQTPDQDQIERIERIRNYAIALGGQIIQHAPEGRAQSLALTHLEDCAMWAVKAVVLEGKL